MQLRFLFKRFTIINFIIFSLLVLAGCQKEKSLETPGSGSGVGGTSSFTLLPSGSDCSDAMTTGTFVEGTAVAVTDFVIVSVDVTKLGTWSYNTGTVNGFYFSGSGTFTAAGNQVIALKASGKPTTAGNFSFPLNIGSVNCSFSIPVNTAGGNNPNPAPGDPYYKATIGGVNYMESVTATNDYIAGSGMGGTDDVDFGAGISYSTYPAPAGFTEMGVGKGIMHGYLAATDARFKAFFAVGNHPFTPPAPELRPYQNGDGIVISWTDKQGKNWSSSHPTQSQPAGSSFKIISVEDAPDITGTFYIKVKMQFNCILYKEGTAETATLTNGEMVAYFGKLP